MTFILHRCASKCRMSRSLFSLTDYNITEVEVCIRDNKVISCPAKTSIQVIDVMSGHRVHVIPYRYNSRQFTSHCSYVPHANSNDCLQNATEHISGKCSKHHECTITCNDHFRIQQSHQCSSTLVSSMSLKYICKAGNYSVEWIVKSFWKYFFLTTFKKLSFFYFVQRFSIK